MNGNSTYDLNQNSGYLIMKAAQTYRSAIAEVLRPYNLTPTQFFITMAVWFYESKAIEPTQAQVADAAATDINVASQVVRRLCGEGIIKRAVKISDSRAYVLSLTKKGRDLAQMSSKSVQRCHTNLFGAMDEDAIQSAMLHFLNQIK